MLELFTYPAAFGAPAASPFCVKAMCLLKASEADWKAIVTSDPRNAPKAKLPYLRDGETLIPDSDEIRDYLEYKYSFDFDDGLSQEERAISRAVIRMAEENLYFVLVCNRWIDDDNWAVARKVLFRGIPKPLFGFVTRQVRKTAIASLIGQGMGRHSAKERAARASKDLDAIAVLLGDKEYLFGNTPTAADYSVIPILQGLATSDVETPSSILVTRNVKLMAYIERGVGTIYPS